MISIINTKLIIMEETMEEPIFEIKKWNAVALWAWGKIN
jgi:hypothetical protein